jgi:site-specific recombinase XerD
MAGESHLRPVSYSWFAQGIACSSSASDTVATLNERVISNRKCAHAAAERAKITKLVGWNTFRHSLASLLGDKKEDRKIVQEIMGHASSRMLDVYQHGNLEAKRLALNHASGIFVLPAKAS